MYNILFSFLKPQIAFGGESGGGGGGSYFNSNANPTANNQCRYGQMGGTTNSEGSGGSYVTIRPATA